MYFYPATRHTGIKVTGSIAAKWPHKGLSLMAITENFTHGHIIEDTCSSDAVPITLTPRRPKSKASGPYLSHRL